MKMAIKTHLITRNLHHAPLAQQRGFTLVEVMIVFFVLSVGLLGMAALQMKSMQYNQSSYIRSQATLAAYDILDRMRVNKAVALAGTYNVLVTDPDPTGTSIAATDIQTWRAFLASTLPGGLGQVQCVSATSQCSVTVRWVDRVTGGQTGSGGTMPDVTVTAQM